MLPIESKGHAAASAVGSSAEQLTIQLLLQLVVILIVSRVARWCARRFFGQTDVVGEIIAGLILGPSVLGRLWPEAMTSLFDPRSSSIFIGFSQVGLILLMFQIGLEFEFKTALASHKRVAVLVSLVGILAPFSMGYVAAHYFYAALPPSTIPEVGFRLFFATAMSITAIPILGRIFQELGLSHTRTAAVVITAAAIDDICGWILLSVVSAIVALRFDMSRVLVRVMLLGGYVAFIYLVVRPLLRQHLGRRVQDDMSGFNDVVSAMVVILFLSSIITSFLGVYAIIGGFIIGFAMHEDRRFVRAWSLHTDGILRAVFLPIFFAYTGLRTNIGSIEDTAGLLQCAAICVIAFAGKFGGAYAASRVAGEPPRRAAAIGICMNTRALMELVVINVGYDIGVIPLRIYTMFVVMALLSTFIATPIIKRLLGAERSTGVANRAQGRPAQLKTAGLISLGEQPRTKENLHRTQGAAFGP